MGKGEFALHGNLHLSLPIKRELRPPLFNMSKLSSFLLNSQTSLLSFVKMVRVFNIIDKMLILN